MSTEIPLAARINGARAWRPAKDRTSDEMLSGTLVAITRRGDDGEYGAYPCLVIDTGEPSFRAFHAFHTVAQQELKKLKPTPGESITIVAHPRVQANKRKDSKGDPVEYDPYTIFNPDHIADKPAINEWDWDAESDRPGF